MTQAEGTAGRFTARRVDDVDLRAELDEPTRHRLRGLLAESAVLVFHQEGLSVEDQIRLMECFGPVRPEPGAAELFAMISNSGERALVTHSRRLLFHSDALFRPEPYVALSLYALEVPAGGAPTSFARTAADRLPDDLAGRLRARRGLFLTTFGGGDKRYRATEAGAGAESCEHPLVVAEALGGSDVVLVDELFLAGVAGLAEPESEALRRETHEHLYDEANVHLHRWAENDLVVWSNLAAQHGRPAFDEGGRRVLRRVVASRA